MPPKPDRVYARRVRGLVTADDASLIDVQDLLARFPPAQFDPDGAVLLRGLGIAGKRDLFVDTVGVLTTRHRVHSPCLVAQDNDVLHTAVRDGDLGFVRWLDDTAFRGGVLWALPGLVSTAARNGHTGIVASYATGLHPTELAAAADAAVLNGHLSTFIFLVKHTALARHPAVLHSGFEALFRRVLPRSRDLLEWFVTTHTFDIHTGGDLPFRQLAANVGHLFGPTLRRLHWFVKFGGGPSTFRAGLAKNNTLFVTSVTAKFIDTAGLCFDQSACTRARPSTRRRVAACAVAARVLCRAVSTVSRARPVPTRVAMAHHRRLWMCPEA